MIDFKISLAGFVIYVAAYFDSTKYFCRDYLADENAETDFSVSVTKDDIVAEKEKSEAENILEGIPVRDYTDSYLETLALYRKIIDILIDRDVLLFHGSAVALNGKAYIFTAVSGTGKTTHTRLWLKNIAGSYVLNGDKPLLRLSDDTFYVCGTPWQGKENYGVNEMLPLEAICILERDTVNHIERISSKEAFAAIINQSYRPRESEKLIKCVRLVGRLCQTKLYRLGCNTEDEAAFVSHRGMTENV